MNTYFRMKTLRHFCRNTCFPVCCLSLVTWDTDGSRHTSPTLCKLPSCPVGADTKTETANSPNDAGDHHIISFMVINFLTIIAMSSFIIYSRTMRWKISLSSWFQLDFRYQTPSSSGSFISLRSHEVKFHIAGIHLKCMYIARM